MDQIIDFLAHKDNRESIERKEYQYYGIFPSLKLSEVLSMPQNGLIGWMMIE
jgi:hypothetical protein